MAGKGLGGKQLTYETVMPRFLQAAVARQHASEEREAPGSADEASDEPLVVADEETQRQYEEQKRLEKLQQEALDAERAYHEEQRLQRAAQARSKFDTSEATTHVFRPPPAAPDPSSKKRAAPTPVASAAKKARTDLQSRKPSLLSFATDDERDEDAD